MLTDFGAPLPSIACPQCFSDRVARMGIPVGDPHIRCLVRSCWHRSTVKEAAKAWHQRKVLLIEEEARSLPMPDIERLTKSLNEKLKTDRYITQLEVCVAAGFSSYAPLKRKTPEYMELMNRLKMHNANHPAFGTPGIMRPVLKLDLKTLKVLQRFESVRDAARSVDIDPICIGSCCKGKSRSSAGFTWRYEDEWLKQNAQCS